MFRVALLPSLLVLATMAMAVPNHRMRVNLNTGWRFLRADAPGAEKAGFDDTGWQTVNLPHTYNNLDGQDGGNNYYRGPTWYRRHFTISPSQPLQKCYLEFEGANQSTVAYLNGQLVGRHDGGYTAFRFDISDKLNRIGDNVLAVSVTNAFDPNIPPLSADFTFCGGIYRNVNLLFADPIQISAMDYGSSGVYAYASSIAGQNAELRVTTKLVNATHDSQTVEVAHELITPTGRQAAKASGTLTLGPGEERDAATVMAVRGPHLWNGRKDPFVYKLRTEVSCPLAGTDDVVEVPCGIRSYAVDANAGFGLNGEHVDLHGVNKHQDRRDKGWAVSPADEDQDFALTKELGVNMLRMCHYPHDQHELDLADRSGIVVWAELGMVNYITDTPAFTDSARRQLTELIRQQYNHPSICFWSLANEVTNQKGPPPAPLLAELNTLAHLEDPTRLTTQAVSADANNAVAKVGDVIAFNRYYGWYNGKLGDFAPWLDRTHSAHPSMSMGMSEYGAGAGPSTHSETPKNQDHTEEYQCFFHEAYWRAMNTRPWLWCKLLWVMCDFASDGRKEGEHLGINDKGLITQDRKIRKDSFYFYKANWTTDPFVYIASRRFTHRTGPTTTVKVYTTLPAVNLTVNGVPLGLREADQGTCVWDNVLLIPGDNSVRASGGDVSDSVVWTRTR